MTLVVTAASGHLGRLVVDNLLERGVPAGDIVATARSTEKIADLAERGVTVRRLDYDDPSTFGPALAGADRVLLISGSEIGKRVKQHTGIAEAARDAGAALLAYTSIAAADTTPIAIAPEHKATEKAIRALGIPYSFLRNSWYHENYTAQIPTYLQFGAVTGSAGAGRISGASRADYAEAAAAVLTGTGHENTVYELGGDESYTLAELAATVTEASGKPIAYRDLPVAEYAKVLEGAGLPAPVAAAFAETDAGIKAGGLLVESGHLHQLIGHATTPLRTSVQAALA